jgi:hypothetical protein
MDDGAFEDWDAVVVRASGSYVLLEDGGTVPITEWLDCDGDECEPCDAVTCVAGSDDFGWIVIVLPERAAAERMH